MSTIHVDPSWYGGVTLAAISRYDPTSSDLSTTDRITRRLFGILSGSVASTREILTGAKLDPSSSLALELMSTPSSVLPGKFERPPSGVGVRFSRLSEETELLRSSLCVPAIVFASVP